MKLTYVSNSRMPTGHAHGLQIMYMCEEFAKQGAEVELVVPAKKNFHEVDPFTYYGVDRLFHITRITVPDLASRISLAPSVTFLVDLFFYGLALYFQPISKERIIYTRDYALLLFLPRSVKIFLEVHDVPRARWIFTWAASRAAGFVAITGGVKDALIKRGVRSEKIIIAPDGVHVQDFKNPESREAARRRLRLPVDKKVAMYIGRIDGWKGTDTLFEAAARIPDVQTVVIGARPDALLELARRYTAVKFFAMRPYKELADNQAVADVLVLPASGRHTISARYTSPLKLFSYMTSGIPIVASDLPSLREVIDGKSAFLFKPDDAEDLARVINYVIAHPEEGAEKARIAKKLVTGYTWEARAKSILAFIRAHL